MHNLKEVHLWAAHRIIQYLKGTLGNGVLFKRGNELTLEAYTDSNYVGSDDDKRVTLGYCTFLESNLVMWSSKK